MELKNDQYVIQEIPVTQIAEEFGTPLYVYDADKILEQYNRLVSAFQDTKLKINYACKALNNINILKLLKQAGSGLDAVSIQEVYLGLKAGFKPEDIIYTPNMVSFEEIKEAISLGVHVNIDNIPFLEYFGHEFGSRVPICIRINPHIAAGGHLHIQTGHIDSKFGISVYQVRHIKRIIDTYKLRVTGLHMHTGSDILDSTVFIKGMEVLFEVASEFPDLEFLDFGSGFKVGYRTDDVTTDIEDLGKKVTKSFNNFCKAYGRELELWFEPGKFLVSEAGHFLMKVNVIKQTTSTVFAGVDTGQNHLIRPMFYEAYHHIFNVSNPTGQPRVYSVVGYICETDTLGADRKINEVREGDILAIANAGAYCYTMSSNYNSRFKPAEVMVYGGKAHLIRKRETLDDLTKNQIEIEMNPAKESLA